MAYFFLAVVNRMQHLTWVALLVAVVAFVASRGRPQSNEGNLVPSNFRQNPTSIMSAAAVLRVVQESLSTKLNCRVEITTVKTLNAVRTDNGGAVYRLDAFVMNTCTLAHTFERMTVTMGADGSVDVRDVVDVTPIPALARASTATSAQILGDIIAATGPDTIDKGGQKLGVGYTTVPLQPYTSDAAAFPHMHVQSPETFAAAPPEIPDVQDFSIFNQMQKEPLQDLTNALAYEKSALSIMYN